MILAGIYCATSGLALSTALAEHTYSQTQSELIEYNIPAQALDDALRQYAEQSDLQIIFAPQLVAELNSTAVKGTHSAVGGLGSLLSDTFLEFVFINTRTVVIKPRSLSQNQLANTVSTATVSEPEQASENDEKKDIAETEAGTETLKGHVISAYTGKPLAGVIIEAPDLGMRTTSNARGRYMVDKVPVGNIRLVLRYFGQSAEEHFISLDQRDDAEVDLRFGYTEIEEIVVTGARAASNYSVSRQRISANITSVLASDLTGELPDRTLAEALRRAPGVSFQRSERGGDGEFISVRGLDAGLNYVTVNGIAAPATGIGDDRRIALDSFDTDGISQIIINKTLLPHQPSEGIGGVIDIDTSTATKGLSKRTSLALESVYSDFSDKLGYRASGSLSETFGSNDEFNISASFFASRRFLRTFQFDVLGTFLPASLPIADDGKPFSSVRGLNFSADDLSVLEDIRYNVFDDRRDRYGAVIALSWQVSEQTKWSFDTVYNRRNIDTVRSTFGFEQDDEFTDTISGSDTLIDPNTGQFFFVGENPFIRYRAEVEDQDREVFVTSFKSETYFDGGAVVFGGGYSDGRETLPLSSEIDFTLDGLSQNVLPTVAPTGAQFITFDISNPRFPSPNLTDEGFAAITDPANFNFLDARLQSSFEFDQRYTAYIDTEFDLDSKYLENIKFGVRYERVNIGESRVRFFDGGGIGALGEVDGLNQFSLADTQLFDDELISFSQLGNPVSGFQGLIQASRAGILDFTDNLISTLNPTELGAGVDDFFQSGREDKIAFYVSGVHQSGENISIIGGVRFEQYFGEFQSSRLLEIEGRLNDQDDIVLRADSSTAEHVSNFEILPRFIVNYTPNEQWALKFGFFESIVRPTFSTIATPEVIEVDEEAGRLSLSLNQPNARNARASNLDLSFQYFGLADTFFEANFFYKTVSNFALQRSFEIERPATSGEIDALQQELSGFFSNGLVFQRADVETQIAGVSAEIYGLDLAFVHQFKALPGWLSGFGVRAGFLWQDSRVSLPSDETFSQSLTLFNSPSLVGTVGLLYEKYGFNASTFLSYQGRQLDSFGGAFPNEFEEPFLSLDMRLEYRFRLGHDQSASLYFIATDITDGGLKPINHETAGVGERLLDDVEFNGREVRFGVRYNF